MTQAQVVIIYTHGHTVHSGTQIHCGMIFNTIDTWKESFVAAFLYINGYLEEKVTREKF
ncbi:hypothetical protein AU106_gp241 [Sinorhizobium phage phiM9]|uniref:Uncharacterized protein n=1 Tax=Sinorhizobium phage phiM9 TaxID=1636182 RepID=A0A0F6R558_9CAUD|nr:hypothetical protein AU106_gp241 [Sinorhizobium phage phiM9]AKE44872.1 hypothetical protein Sm_phiM9_245 [Sinorhizobium phage phiM9]